MKTLLRFAVAGALMAGYATAQAQSLPGSGSSDLWLFVSDQAAKTTFAEDTGISLSSLLPGPYTAGASLNTSQPANFTVAASAALTAYINAANSSSQTLEWAVLGSQYGASNPSDPSNQTAGASIAVYDYASGTTANSKVKAMTFANMSNVGNGLNGDLSTLVGSYTTGGTSYALGNPNFNVWGEGTGAVGGSTNLYGQGLDQSNIGLGTQTTLFGVTGNGNAGKVQSYVLGTNLTLTSAGVLQVSSVPLPAAVWLFGSGLLGLIGVGRRKVAAAAV
jgi:hypothetical protein